MVKWVVILVITLDIFVRYFLFFLDHIWDLQWTLGQIIDVYVNFLPFRIDIVWIRRISKSVVVEIAIWIFRRDPLIVIDSPIVLIKLFYDIAEFVFEKRILLDYGCFVIQLILGNQFLNNSYEFLLVYLSLLQIFLKILYFMGDRS